MLDNDNVKREEEEHYNPDGDQSEGDHNPDGNGSEYAYQPYPKMNT